MSEMSSRTTSKQRHGVETSAQRPAGAAESERAERFRLRLVTGAILLALALAVVMLRFPRLSELPPDLHPDEGAHGLNALQVLRGEHAVFFPEQNGREGLVVYAIAFAISLLGRTVLALRLPTALASAGTVFAVFWLARLLFGRDESGRATPWRGLFVGGVGAGLLAVSLSQTVLGRSAYRGNYLPLLLSLLLALLWWAWSQKSWWKFALAGACAGLLPYTYISARFTPFLFLFFGLSFLPYLGRGEKEGAGKERRSLSSRFSVLTSPLEAGPFKRTLSLIGVFLGVAGLVAAPIFVYFALHPEDFFYRSVQVSIFHPDRRLIGSLEALLVNTWDHLLAFGFHGDENWRYNFAGKPMLNLLETFFFWVGVGMAVWRWKHRPAYRLLLLWAAVLLLPAILADYSPHFLRMIGATPAIYLLIGIGTWEVFRFLRERCRALPWRMGLICRESETKFFMAVGVVVCSLIFIQGVLTYRTYFQEWAAMPQIHIEPDTLLGDVGQVLRTQPLDMDAVYLIPGFSWSHSVFTFDYSTKYLYQAHVLTMAAPDIAQQIESTLAGRENLSTVKVVEWNTTNSHVEDDSEPFDFLLRKYGRYLGSEQYADFRVHIYTSIVLDRPWTFYDYLQPFSVHYDGGISLRGFALGQGEEQLSTQKLAEIEQVRPIWGVVQWQVSPGLEVDYSVSFRLYDDEGEGVYQEDTILWRPTNHTLTSEWYADEPVDTLFHLELPTDLSPGEYELRLIVYSTETQIPTVEIGVWEPEVVLARLRLMEGG